MVGLGKAYLDLQMDPAVHLLEPCSACPYSQDPCRLSEGNWPLAAPLLASHEGLLGRHRAEAARLSPGRADLGHSRHLDAGFRILDRILLLLRRRRRCHSRRPDTHWALRSLSLSEPAPLNQHTAAVGFRIHPRMPLLLITRCSSRSWGSYRKKYWIRFRFLGQRKGTRIRRCYSR